MQAEIASRAVVLVIEDDPWTRAVETSLLADEGYTVVEAASGEEGLRLVRQRPPDVILLDLGLPARSGLDVLDLLRGDPATREIPVVVVSAYALLVDDASGPGRLATVQKPFDVADLLAQVDRAVESRQRAVPPGTAPAVVGAS